MRMRPAMIIAVLCVLSIASAGCASSSEHTTAISPSATSAATQAGPTTGGLVILSPVSGDVVTSGLVLVRGIAPAGARVVRDISLAPDDSVIASADGSWELSVDLKEGDNQLTFRLGDDKSTQLLLQVALATQPPAAVASPEVVLPAPTPTPTIQLVDAEFTVGTNKVTFRGTRGSYTWTSPYFSADSTLIQWNVAAGPGSCSVQWDVADSYGDSSSGHIKVVAKKRDTGSKKIDTSVMVDPSIAFTSTCPKWTVTMVKAPVKKNASSGGSNCDPNYTGYCVPIVSYDLDCADIGHQVYVVGYDKHGFDADGDGIGCESY